MIKRLLIKTECALGRLLIKTEYIGTPSLQDACTSGHTLINSGQSAIDYE
ncbi:MAG: hypothetical protein ACKO6M_04395 [Bacteroidota bacterium]